MQIRSVSLKIPSKKITNELIYRYLEEYNSDVSWLKKKTYLRMIHKLLNKSGSRVRYLRDLEIGEKAKDMIIDAMKEAIEKAGISKNEIDLLIYCGVGKGFLEPASSYFYAKALGISPACFDIGDACMSWVRALEIADAFLRNNTYRHILIVNGEFNAYDHGFPENFRIKNLRQAEYTFPTYTIGEAATATVVAQSNHVWRFHFKSVPELVDLCTIPLAGYRDYVETNKKHGLNGNDNFVSFGGKMFKHAERYLSDLVKESIGNLNDPDIYFPHAASDNIYLSQAKKIGIREEKIFTEIFPNYGNVVSASIPAGLWLALKQKRLKRGHRVIFCPASAGMSFATVEFTF